MCKALQLAIGRPFLCYNNYANLFVFFMVLNIIIFLFVVLPGIISWHTSAAFAWLLCMGGCLALWRYSCSVDPGWMGEATLRRQPRPAKARAGTVGGMGQEEEEEPTCLLPILQMFLPQQDLPAEASELPPSLSFDETPRKEAGLFDTREMPLRKPRNLCSAGEGVISTTISTRGGSLNSPRQVGILSNGNEVYSPESLDDSPGPRSLLFQQTRPAQARISRLHREGRHEYIELLHKGSFKQLCVVCRVTKEMRSHHCKECGRCVHRLDHHCPWIDNCVGLGNQRSFICFLVVLFSTMLANYYCMILYLAGDVNPLFLHGDFVDALALKEWSLSPILVVMLCLSDLIWLAFVCMLLLRHSAYVLANVTTFEVLVQPPHMQRRFPRAGDTRFWYLHGLSLIRGVQHCISYWTLDTSQDVQDFTGFGGIQGDFTDFTAGLEIQGEEGDDGFGDPGDLGQLGPVVTNKLSRCESTDKSTELMSAKSPPRSDSRLHSDAGDIHRRALTLRVIN